MGNRGYSFSLYQLEIFLNFPSDLPKPPNPKYLSHIFKKEMGMNYSEYLNNARISYAVSLFNHGVDSVKNVAFLSGFNDPLYFSSVFKKNTGLSPKEYKERQV